MTTLIKYRQAALLSDGVLRRWLDWAMKGDPLEARIRSAGLKTKTEVLRALVWMGAIS